MTPIPPKGIGFARIGTTPVGYGEPATDLSTRAAIYTKSDGTAGKVRLIDPATRDYVVDDDGIFIGGDALSQRVYLALVTIKGSSVLDNLGQEFSKIRVSNENTELVMEDLVRAALSDLINEGSIDLVSTSVVIANSRATVAVKWRDRSTEELRQTNV